VLAAADAEAIVTSNVRHFPAAACEPYGIEDPDAFLSELHERGPAGATMTGHWAGQRVAELQRAGLVSRDGNRWSLTLLTAFAPHHSRTADTRDPCAHEAGEAWASVIRPLASVLQPAVWVLVSGSCSSFQLSLCPGLRWCSAILLSLSSTRAGPRIRTDYSTFWSAQRVSRRALPA